MEAVEESFNATFEEVVDSLAMENTQLRLQLLAAQISNEKLVKRVRELENAETQEEEEDANDPES